MVQGRLDSEEFDLRDTDNIDNKILGFGINRELSFSRWCNEDSRVHLDQQLGNADASREEARDSDFELPFIETDQLQIRYQRGMSMNDVGTMGDDSVYLKGNRSEKYVPLDIENGAARKKVVQSTVSLDYSHGSLRESSTNLVSVSDILKTLFFILLCFLMLNW